MRSVVLAAVLAGLGPVTSAVPVPAPAGGRDQAAWVTKAQAEAAAEILRGAPEVLFYCEPCGETEPDRYPGGRVQVRYTGVERFFQVYMDGEGLDLAYTFVPLASSGTWANVAVVLGLPVVDVSPVYHGG